MCKTASVTLVALILLPLLLCACHCGGQTTWNPPPSYTPVSGSAQTPTPTPVPNPPLNVHLEYVGITYTHDREDIWDSHGEVQIVVVVTDGITQTDTVIPPAAGGYPMEDFETKSIDQRIFHTSSVGDYLKVQILAYDIDSKSETLDFLSMAEALGVPEAGVLKVIYQFLPEEDDFIGYYEHTWYPDENWGIGQYPGVGFDDLRVWFSIYSDVKPPAPLKPILLPDVKIQSVSVPSQVEQCPWWYLICPTFLHSMTLINNEEHSVTVDWQGHSSATGDFDSGSVTVAGLGTEDVNEWYSYQQETGSVVITFTIFYEGTELDSRSAVVEVVPE